jgi:stage II sporulation protein AA (anti-sigma F factor antagonist)
VEIQLQRQGAVTVIKPVGALITTDAEAFRAKAVEAARTALGRVVCDASAVPFVDSRGIEALLDVSDELAAGGRALKLCAANPTVREVLELTGVADAFEYFPDAPAAVRSFL